MSSLMTATRRALPGLLALAGMLLFAGCEKGRHDMYDQPRYKPMAPSLLFGDGASARPQVPGTVPYSHGNLSGTSSGRAGADDADRFRQAAAAQTNPYPVDMQLLRRGQDRYTIYCLPCHSPAGDGDGWITRRGFPHPPSYHSERLRQASDRHFFEVITNGYGIMYPYADRVDVPDRWAIVAYIRALQLSQHAPAGKLPADLKARLPADAANGRGQQ